MGRLIILLPILAVAVFVYASVQSSKDSKEYREACIKSGGVTVFNGRHNECIKEKSK